MCYNIPATRVAGTVPVAKKENIGYHKSQALRGMVSYTGRTCNWQLRGALFLEKDIMALTQKRKVFIEEYLRSWNATRAAEAAGFKHPRVQGSYLLSRPDVQEHIDRRLKQLEVSPKRVPVYQKRRPANQVYIIQEEHGLVKIGKTCNFKSRLRRLSSMMPYELNVIILLITPVADLLEEAMHNQFAEQHVKGEWFSLDADRLGQAVTWLYQLNEELLSKST